MPHAPFTKELPKILEIEVSAAGDVTFYLEGSDDPFSSAEFHPDSPTGSWMRSIEALVTQRNGRWSRHGYGCPLDGEPMYEPCETCDRYAKEQQDAGF